MNVTQNTYRIEYVWLDDPNENPRLSYVEFLADHIDQGIVDAEISFLRGLGRNVLGIHSLWQVIDFKNPTYSTN